MCSACTFENGNDLDACEICTTPRPPVEPKKQEVEIKQTNYSSLNSFAKQREKEFYSALLNSLKEQFEGMEVWEKTEESQPILL